MRYALGYHNLNKGEFDLRTLYYFRDRTSRYYLETGINLLGVLFKDLTGKQIEAYQLNTRVQRMDSAQIMSNIVSSTSALFRAFRVYQWSKNLVVFAAQGPH